MSVLIQDLPNNPGLDSGDQIVVNDVDALDNTTKVTIGGLRDWIRDNISIPTNISDITGLDAALNGKANTVHTHSINQIDGLQGELNTKLDSDDAHIEGQVVTIDGVSVTVPSAVAGGDDARIPNSTTAGNLLRFAGTDGGIEQRSPSQFRSDIGLDSVDNTLDVNKPVSTAQNAAIQASGHDLSLVGNQLRLVDGDGNNIGVANFGDGVTNLSYGQNAENNVITSDTGTDATLLPATDGLAGLMSRQDKTKLDTVEMGADATDTTNVWSSLGVSSGGRTNYALSERGVFVQIPDSAGNVLPVVTEVHTEQVSIASGGGTATFTITGIENNLVNIAIVNSNPANWIINNSLSETQVTIGTNGEATVTATVPSFSELSGSRSFQVQVQADGAFQPAVTSEVVTQYSASQLITGVSLSTLSFGNTMEVETVNVTGVGGEGYSLELIDVTPAGWITSGALSATTGVVGMDGTDSTVTITLPVDDDDTYTRSFRLRARANDDANIFAESSLIVQSHTQTTAAGNLSANTNLVFGSGVINISANILTGDQPFTLVLNQNATDATDNPIETLNVNALGTHNFAALSATDFTSAVHNFYIHISDNDSDVVIAMESVDLSVNEPPSGTISQTTGAMSPAIGDNIVFTSAFTDPEGDALTYQWQNSPYLIDTTQTVDALGTYDSSTAFSYYPDSAADGAALISSGSVFIFAGINAGLVSIIVWADGVDHSTAAPIAYISSSSSFGGDNAFGTNRTFSSSDITYLGGNDEASLFASASGTTDMTQGGSASDFSFWNTDRVELFQGSQTPPFAFTDIAGETGVTYEFEAANRVTAVWENLPSTLSLPAVGATINLATSSFTIDDDFFGPSISQELTTQLVSIDIADGTTGTKTLTVVFDHVGISDGVGTTDSNTVLSSWSLVVDGDTTYTQDATTAGLGDRQVDDFSEAEVFPGLYRCQVTAVQGDTTPVNSNEIELT